MALGNRYKTAPGAGTLAALILVLVFGSPWYSDWVNDNTNPETAGGPARADSGRDRSRPGGTGRAGLHTWAAASALGTSKMDERDTVPMGVPSCSTTTLSESTVSIAASAS